MARHGFTGLSVAGGMLALGGVTAAQLRQVVCVVLLAGRQGPHHLPQPGDLARLDLRVLPVGQPSPRGFPLYAPYRRWTAAPQSCKRASAKFWPGQS